MINLKIIFFIKNIFFCILAAAKGLKSLGEIGEMTEWLKVHAWKACVRQKCTEGSNPSFSADF